MISVLPLQPRNGGVVMVNFYNDYVTCRKDATLSDVAGIDMRWIMGFSCFQILVKLIKAREEMGLTRSVHTFSRRETLDKTTWWKLSERNQLDFYVVIYNISQSFHSISFPFSRNVSLSFNLSFITRALLTPHSSFVVRIESKEIRHCFNRYAFGYFQIISITSRKSQELIMLVSVVIMMAYQGL